MSEKKFKCPYCDKKYDRHSLINHIESKHPDLIPEGYTATRVVFNMINKKEFGTCVVCKRKTQWNEKTGKYNRLCGDPKCTKTMREEAKKNHIKVYGVSTLLNDPYHQEKMLANRSISGKYKFSDGGIHTYTGQYEKKCLEFFDKVVRASSDDIMSPGPILEYKFKGQTKQYITDIYYIPYNLIIECKDGGDNPNNREMQEYRDKQIAKEQMITDQGTYNYLRLTNNNFAQLLEIMAELKMNLLDNDTSDKKIVKVYESYDPAMDDSIPPSGVYMYKFRPSTEIEIKDTKYGISNDIVSDRFLMYDKGKMVTKSSKDFENYNVSIYKYEGDKIKIRNLINIPQEYKPENTTLNTYELLTEREMLCDDQIDYDPDFIKIDLNNHQKRIDIINSTIIGEANRLQKKNIETLACSIISEEYKDSLGLSMKNSDIFEDLNGYFVKNINTGYRSKSVKDINDIDLETVMMVDNEDFLKERYPISQLGSADNDITNFKSGYNSYIDHLNLPFFTPEELMDFGYYDGEGNSLYDAEIGLHDNDGFTVSEWFKNYKYAYNGVYTEDYSNLYNGWNNIMNNLQSRLDIARIENDTEDEVNIKEDMISIGWNPIMDYNIENETKASNRVRNIIESNIMEFDDLDNIIIEESAKNKKYNPIYVVLLSGNSIVSGAIKKFTKNTYSHAALGLDEKLDRLYSYNMSKQYKGFSIESLKKYGENCKVAVFVVFVSDKIKKQIESIIDDFDKHRDQSAYSFMNVLAIPFNKVVSYDYKIICSQFVDSVLKRANINVNKKNSSLTVPADLYDSFIYDNKVFNAFEGKIKDYNPKNILKRIKVMQNDIGFASENAIREQDLPVRFDEEGNLLIKHIKNMKPSDYEMEFARSHRILKTAEKSSNLSTIKYELCRLWFLNLSIEKELNKRNIKVNVKEDYHKARAKILNDYIKYLAIVEEKDKDFIFGEYYKDSIYNIYETKITKNTINMTLDMAKQLLKL